MWNFVKLDLNVLFRLKQANLGIILLNLVELGYING
jgi:hypothetical protein